MHSLQILVLRTVDYAGLFPPAGLPLEVVAANYADYLRSPGSPMLGRLVIPAGRLADLASVTRSLPDHSVRGWQISALVPAWNEQNVDEFVSACRAIDDFNDRQGNGLHELVVDSIESKIDSTGGLTSLVKQLPRNVECFLEVDHREDPRDTISRIRSLSASNIFAKIRTGSVVADQIATTAEVARFIVACRENSVGFKATAGLHHPIRAEYRLTYEENAPCALLHGFLNVFVAAVIAFEHRVDAQTIEDILAEETHTSFEFEPARMIWREFAVPTERIAHWRKRGLLSFGSCSFEEPMGELMALGYPDLFASVKTSNATD